MKLIRCENGHFYDSDAFSACPHCAPEASAPEKPDNSGGGQPESTVSSRAPLGNIDPNLIVGWLVAIEGKHFGKDFKLKPGANNIGRGNGMDVQLSSDLYVSREKHAVLVYDANNNSYYVQPGASKNPFYLNGNVVSSSIPLRSGDILELGDSKLVFAALCTDKFNWSMINK